MTDKESFKYLVKENIQRKGIDTVLDNLEHTDFYTAPASTKYHDSVEGGLVHHSIKVFEKMVELCKDITFPIESMAIVALFHDICKIGFYKVEMRNTKDENGKWISVPYYTVNDQFPLGHGEKSVMLLMPSIELLPDEMIAINAHMGGFDDRKSVISNSFSTCPLAVYLHMADLLATYCP